MVNGNNLMLIMQEPSHVHRVLILGLVEICIQLKHFASWISSSVKGGWKDKCKYPFKDFLIWDQSSHIILNIIKI